MSFLITRHKSPDEIKAVVTRLGAATMRPSSHGYKDFGQVSILEAAKKQAGINLSNGDSTPAAIRVIAVVLAANRDYNKQVEPHVKRMANEMPHLTFERLHKLVASTNYVEFKKVWGHKDEKKFNLLSDLLNAIEQFMGTGQSDLDAMTQWAKAANTNDRTVGPFANIPNFGIATRQHLRIVFGADTVKPDQRVKEVIDREFGVKTSSEKAIQIVEEIAEITGYRTTEIDQIFVKYGSGYYVKD